MYRARRDELARAVQRILLRHGTSVAQVSFVPAGDTTMQDRAFTDLVHAGDGVGAVHRRSAVQQDLDAFLAVDREFHDDYVRWTADPAWNPPTGGEPAIS